MGVHCGPAWYHTSCSVQQGFGNVSFRPLKTASEDYVAHWQLPLTITKVHDCSRECRHETADSAANSLFFFTHIVMYDTKWHLFALRIPNDYCYAYYLTKVTVWTISKIAWVAWMISKWRSIWSQDMDIGNICLASWM
jgi:hypothetical protein